MTQSSTKIYTVVKEKIGVACVLILFFLCNLPIYTRATVTILSLPITQGTVTISAPSSFWFTSIGASFITGTASQDFTGTTNYFIITDLKGIDSWYTTTLQMASDLITGSNRISSGNVSFKADTPTATLLSWVANPRVITDSNATGGFQALNVSRTFIYRATALNTWAISQYAQNITMQVTIPAGQPAGAYSGALVYTVIEN